MNKSFFTILFLALWMNSKAQDVIFLNDGNEVYAKISDTEVEYKKFPI